MNEEIIVPADIMALASRLGYDPELVASIYRQGYLAGEIARLSQPCDCLNSYEASKAHALNWALDRINGGGAK